MSNWETPEEQWTGEMLAQIHEMLQDLHISMWAAQTGKNPKDHAHAKRIPVPRPWNTME